MTNQIESNQHQHLSVAQLEQIRALCAQYRVDKLYLFGSVLTDHFRPDSDIDFLMHFREMDLLDYAVHSMGSIANTQTEGCLTMTPPIIPVVTWLQ